MYNAPHSCFLLIGVGNGKLDEFHLKDVCEMTMEFQEQLKRQFMMQRANNEAGGRYQPFGMG